MKKTLVYHIYLGDDIDTNLAYKVNLECLKYYNNIFDKIRFVIVMDDLKDLELREKGINWINEIGFVGETEIIFRENTEIGEAATVRDYAVNLNIDKEDMVFFGHTKGIGNLRDEKVNKDSVLFWILVMYFYNLNFVDEVKNMFLGKGHAMEVFYGTLLMMHNNENMPVMIPKAHYSGSFYWINKPLLGKLDAYKKISDYTFSGRYDAEFYPGNLFRFDGLGGGMISHNNRVIALDKMLGVFYFMPEELWNKLLEVLGEKEEFLIFKKEIEQRIGFKIFENR